MAPADNRDLIKTPESYLSGKLQRAGINAVVYKLTDGNYQAFQVEFPDGKTQPLNDNTRKPRFGRFNEASMNLNVFIRQERAKAYVEAHRDDYGD